MNLNSQRKDAYTGAVELQILGMIIEMIVRNTRKKIFDLWEVMCLLDIDDISRGCVIANLRCWRRMYSVLLGAFLLSGTGTRND